MSSLLEEAQALTKRPGTVCSVALLARRLDETERAELDEAIASDISATAISKALKARGIDLSYATINRHRASRCVCDVTR